MNLVFLYGPPAVGKLTVAKALSARSGYRVLHNHLSFDFAAAIFEPFSTPFGELLQKLRLLAVRAGSEAGVRGMILTMCYDHPTDNGKVAELDSTVRDTGGEVWYVHLTCSTEELVKRVGNDDRRRYQKLTDPEGLKHTLEKWNLFTPVDGHPSLRIDHTSIDANSAAYQITEHYEGICGRTS